MERSLFTRYGVTFLKPQHSRHEGGRGKNLEPVPESKRAHMLTSKFTLILILAFLCEVGFKTKTQLAQEAQVALQVESGLAGLASEIIPK